jgi:hypothetical protein
MGVERVLGRTTQPRRVLIDEPQIRRHAQVQPNQNSDGSEFRAMTSILCPLIRHASAGYGVAFYKVTRGYRTKTGKLTLHVVVKKVTFMVSCIEVQIIGKGFG